MRVGEDGFCFDLSEEEGTSGPATLRSGVDGSLIMGDEAALVLMVGRVGENSRVDVGWKRLGDGAVLGR